MRNKKAKALRKKLGLKLPISADHRIGKKKEKIVYFTNMLGIKVAHKVERITIINAAKYQYRAIKKIFRGLR